MSYKNTSFKDYFCLKSRESISIDPWQDADQFFGSQELNARISKRIESDFVKPRGVPKFFLFGSYGSGKTHALAHIHRTLLANTMYPTEPVYIDIAPLAAKTKYEQIHARFLDAIGLDRIRKAAEAAADKFSGDKVQEFQNLLPFGDQALKTSQANVFRNLLFGGKQGQMSWEWLKGRKSNVDEAQTLGTQKNLVDAQDFIFCLINIGALYKAGLQKRIVILVDEAEAFRSVTSPDSQTEIKHVLRQLTENSNSYVGLVLAIQSEAGQEQIGEFFTAEDIMRRVDYENGYFDLNGQIQTVGDAKSFATEMLAYLVNQESAAALIENEKLGTSPAYFPFTEEAIQTLSEHASNVPENSSPAKIIAWMSDAAIEAWRQREASERHRLVDHALLEATIFPDA